MNDRQKLQIAKDYIRAHRLGSIVEPIMLMHDMECTWGVHVDWHIFTDALVCLETYGEASYHSSGPDGISRYLIDPGGP